MEAVEARGLPRAVVRVPAPGGVEIAEGIGEMELGGKLVEGGCSEAFCAAARVVVGWGGEWAVGCLSGYGVLEWLRWLWGTTIHPAVCCEIKVPPKDAVGQDCHSRCAGWRGCPQRHVRGYLMVLGR